MTDKVTKKYLHAIGVFGGKELHCRGYGSLQSYLEDIGVEYFTEKELARHYRPSLTDAVHPGPILPPRDYWPKVAALGLLMDKIRRHVAAPVVCKYLWRPYAVNKAVGGAEHSDHLTCDAADLVFQNKEDRAKAELRLLHWYHTGLFEMSLGFYGQNSKTIHVGMYSPRGRRFWQY